MLKTILCDIDGVLADCTHRLPYIQNKPVDWDAFFEACEDDDPIKPVIEFVQELSQIYRISYITGRPERTRNKTIAWLRGNKLPWSEAFTSLWMRRDGDHRQDYQVKLELYKFMSSPIAAVIEDRDQVVEMWRREGLLCLQPKKGDY